MVCCVLSCRLCRMRHAYFATRSSYWAWLARDLYRYGEAPVQTDMTKLVAHSYISHMGFVQVTLGMFLFADGQLTTGQRKGAIIIQTISHGFCVDGDEDVYRRDGTNHRPQHPLANIAGTMTARVNVMPKFAARLWCCSVRPTPQPPRNFPASWASLRRLWRRGESEFLANTLTATKLD